MPLQRKNCCYNCRIHFESNAATTPYNRSQTTNCRCWNLKRVTCPWFFRLLFILLFRTHFGERARVFFAAPNFVVAVFVCGTPILMSLLGSVLVSAPLRRPPKNYDYTAFIEIDCAIRLDKKRKLIVLVAQIGFPCPIYHNRHFSCFFLESHACIQKTIRFNCMLRVEKRERWDPRWWVECLEIVAANYAAYAAYAGGQSGNFAWKMSCAACGMCSYSHHDRNVLTLVKSKWKLRVWNTRQRIECGKCVRL